MRSKLKMQRNMLRAALRLVVAFALLVFFAPARAATTASYITVDLGTFGGVSSFAQGLNNLGQVVGYAKNPSDAFRAFVYQGGMLTDLGGFSGTRSFAQGINDSGQIAGYATITGDTVTHPFLYSDGTMTDLGSSGYDTNLGWAINSAGDVAGGNGNAFIYSNGKRINIATFFSEARAINDSGQIAGYNGHAFIYSGGGNLTDLGTLGGQSSYAFGNNNAGAVVGSANLPGDAIRHAYLYEHGSMMDLGTLGGSISQGTDINESGQIVGYAQIQGNYAYHAFLYEHNVMIDLNSLLDPAAGIVLEDARAINDYGQIVANGTNASGQKHAFLLTLTPEPAGLSLVMMAVVGLLRRRRR